jgi:hypothetical protein
MVSVLFPDLSVAMEHCRGNSRNIRQILGSLKDKVAPDVHTFLMLAMVAKEIFKLGAKL